MIIKSSTRKNKRYVAIFSDGSKTHFGQKGGSTYIDHKDKAKRAAYIARHSKNNEDWTDYKSAGALSRWLLWSETTLPKSISQYKKRFKL